LRLQEWQGKPQVSFTIDDARMSLSSRA